MNLCCNLIFGIILSECLDICYGFGSISHQQIILDWIQRVTQTNSMVLRLQTPEKKLVKNLISHNFLDFGLSNDTKGSHMGSIVFAENENEINFLEKFVVPKMILVTQIKSGTHEE